MLAAKFINILKADVLQIFYLFRTASSYVKNTFKYLWLFIKIFIINIYVKNTLKWTKYDFLI